MHAVIEWQSCRNGMAVDHESCPIETDEDRVADAVLALLCLMLDRDGRA
jgi:hypothetical protein